MTTEASRDEPPWPLGTLVAGIGHVTWPVIVAGGMALVAYTDWRVVANASIGYLYLAPLVLAGMTIRHRAWLLFLAASAAVLREAFGPFSDDGWPLVARGSLVFSTYTLVILLVHRSQQRQRQLADLVDQQRAQFSRDVEEAAALQRLLIPQAFPTVPGWEVSARLWPARVVAGDYFDVLWDEARGELVVVVADVAGKGPAAAMLMPVVQSTVRRLRSTGAAPDALAADLNDVIVRLTDQPRFISLVYVVITVSTGELVYVNMGHPPPVVVKSGAKDSWCWLSHGGPIAGAVPGASYPVGRAHLAEGDTLTLYTDGVSEAENERLDPFTQRRVAEAVSGCVGHGADRVLMHVYNEVEAFRAHPSRRDDVTLIVVRRSSGR